jgi:Uncharacterized protein conserved in bacteria (DUF2188)
MPDITVYRHGDRWTVAEQGEASPSREFPSREAAEMAARQLAGGGAVEVREDDPTGLDHVAPHDAGEPVGTAEPPQPAEVPENGRAEQPGL